MYPQIYPQICSVEASNHILSLTLRMSGNSSAAKNSADKSRTVLAEQISVAELTTDCDAA
jgi:hypothetical protein